MTDLDDRTKRLPKWAQEQMRGMRRQIAELQEALAEGPADSNTFVKHLGTTRRPDRPLGKDAVLRFQLGRDWVECRVIRDSRRGGAELHVTGESQLSVRPQAANVVKVGVAGR